MNRLADFTEAEWFRRDDTTALIEVLAQFNTKDPASLTTHNGIRLVASPSPHPHNPHLILA